MRNSPEHGMPPDPLEEKLKPTHANKELKARIDESYTLLDVLGSKTDATRERSREEYVDTNQLTGEMFENTLQLGYLAADQYWVNQLKGRVSAQTLVEIWDEVQSKRSNNLKKTLRKE